MRVVVASLALILSSGCIVFPHRLQDLPAIEGRVTASGQPAAGVRLHIADVTRSNPCVKGEQSAETDAQGAFATPGRGRLAWLVPLLPWHSTDSWAAALLAGGKAIGYIRPWHYRAGPLYAPREVELQCELDSRTCVVHVPTRRRTQTLQLLPCDGFARDAYSTESR
jgi:hypothetical protein